MRYRTLTLLDPGAFFMLLKKFLAAVHASSEGTISITTTCVTAMDIFREANVRIVRSQFVESCAMHVELLQLLDFKCPLQLYRLCSEFLVLWTAPKLGFEVVEWFCCVRVAYVARSWRGSLEFYVRNFASSLSCVDMDRRQRILRFFITPFDCRR